MTELIHNEEAFVRLIRNNKGILYKICHSYCRSRDDREDLMQEMIYQLWRSGNQFDANYKFSTWMYRIALNVAISFYRKQTRSIKFDAYSEDLIVFSADSDEKVETE